MRAHLRKHSAPRARVPRPDVGPASLRRPEQVRGKTAPVDAPPGATSRVAQDRKPQVVTIDERCHHIRRLPHVDGIGDECLAGALVDRELELTEVFEASGAPGRPEVDEQHLALLGSERDGPAGWPHQHERIIGPRGHSQEGEEEYEQAHQKP